MQVWKTCKHCTAKFLAAGTSVVYCDECNKLRCKTTVEKGVQRVPCRKNFVRYRANARHDGVLHDLGYHLTQEAATAAVKAFRDKTPKVSQGKWSQDNRTTTGIGYFHANRRRIKLERKVCNRCNTNLVTATRYLWCVHHIDHDRTNNVDSNLELLCKSCHQIEHCKHDPKTGQYAQGSTTISKESTVQANGAGSGGKCDKHL